MVKDGNQNRLSLQNKLHNKCKSLIIRGRSDQTDCVDYSQHTRTHINISIYSHSADLLQDRSFIDVINKVKLNVKVMAKNISTLAILSENATLFSENCCSWKWFGTHVYLFFCIGSTKKKNRRKVKSDTIPHRTQKMHWTKLLAPLT